MSAPNARVAAGSPSGGQFASRARAEAQISLMNHGMAPSSEGFGDMPSVPDSHLGDALNDPHGIYASA